MQFFQVALSLIVSRTPFLSLAPWALRELGTVHQLFAKVAEECPRVAQALVNSLAFRFDLLLTASSLC